MAVVRTKTVLSLGLYLSACSLPHTCPYPPWQMGSLLLLASCALPYLPTPHPIWPLSPALLLAQVSKLDTGLVAVEAKGQELLLELEKNQ